MGKTCSGIITGKRMLEPPRSNTGGTGTEKELNGSDLVKSNFKTDQCTKDAPKISFSMVKEE